MKNPEEIPEQHRWPDSSVQQRIQQLRRHESIKQENLKKVRQMTDLERLRFLEKAAVTNPIVIRAWLSRFESQVSQRSDGSERRKQKMNP